MAQANPRPSPETLRQILRYDEVTGKLYWLGRPRIWFETDKGCATWNGKNAGQEAFTAIDAKGYSHGRALKHHMRAHRVVWALAYGEYPFEAIDHINGNPADNRLENLRTVAPADNQRNMKLFVTNASGRVGVSKRRGKWLARICVDRREISLGTFSTRSEASRARAVAERRHGFHRNHGRV